MTLQKLKEFSLGVVLIIVGVWFVFSLQPNPINEYLLIIQGEVVKGKVLRVYTDVDPESGSTACIEYSYKWGKKKYTSYTSDITLSFAELLEPKDSIFVELLERSPEKSRIKGTGVQTLFEWIWRRIILTLVLLIMFSSPGFFVLKKSLCNEKSK